MTWLGFPDTLKGTCDPKTVCPFFWWVHAYFEDEGTVDQIEKPKIGCSVSCTQLISVKLTDVL